MLEQFFCIVNPSTGSNEIYLKKGEKLSTKFFDALPYHNEHDEVDPVPEGVGVLHKVHHVRPPLKRYHLYTVILIFF